MDQVQQRGWEVVEQGNVADRSLSVWWVPVVLVLCLWMAVQNNALAERVDREVSAATFAPH